jgi:hypothetical protein
MASSRLGPLAGLARRIAAPKSALPLKGGGGGPVPLRLPPNTPVRRSGACPQSAVQHAACYQRCCGGTVASAVPFPPCAFHMLQLAEEDELMWDDGTATPEPCLDRFDLVTKVTLTAKLARICAA